MCESLDRQVLPLLFGVYLGGGWEGGLVGICLTFKIAANRFPILALIISPAVGSSSAGLALAPRKDATVPCGSQVYCWDELRQLAVGAKPRRGKGCHRGLQSTDRSQHASLSLPWWFSSLYVNSGID
jgi:hypothetical protein